MRLKHFHKLVLFILITIMLIPDETSAESTQKRLVAATNLSFEGKAISDVRQVAAGSGFTLALKNDGTVWTWGENIGTHLTTTAVKVSGLTDIRSITVAPSYENTAAAIKKDGTAWILGRIRYGSFEEVTYTTDRPAFFSSPKKIEGLTDVKDIKLGSDFALALKKDGTVWAWGSNEYGGLGDGTVKSHAKPELVTGLPEIKSIYIDGNAAFAIDQKGRLWYWGSPYWYYYQTSRQAVITKPRLFEKLDHIKAITGSTVLVRTDGTVWSFGDNFGGMLGRVKDPKEGYLEPHPIPELQSIKAVSCDYLQCLALDQHDRVWVWGNNDFRQIGDGRQPHRFDHPVMLDRHEAVDVVSGVRSSFLIKKDGTIWGAGLNGDGQIGRGILGEWRGEEGFGVRPFAYQPVYLWESFAVTRYSPVLEAPQLLVNGRRIDTWSIEIDGSVYTSVRDILESMGYRVEWNAEEKTALAIKDGAEILFDAAKTGVSLNGHSVSLGENMYNIRGQLLVPVREFGRVSGWTTIWDRESYTIRVTDSGS